MNCERDQQKGLRPARHGGRGRRHPDGLHVEAGQRRPTARADAPIWPDQANRRRRPQRRLRRGGPARWAARHPAPRLALRHPRLCRRVGRSSPTRATESSSPTFAASGPPVPVTRRTVRNGQQAALANDVVALMDALRIPSADPRRIRLGRPHRQRRRCPVATAVHRPRRRQRLHRRQPRKPTSHRCRRRPSTAGGTSTTSPPLAGSRLPPATRRTSIG